MQHINITGSHFIRSFMLVLMAMVGVVLSSTTAALTVGTEYTVVLSKINGDGTSTSVSSTSAIADSNGKITFSLTNLPTATDTNFVLLEIKDPGGTVVRQSIAPAPAAGSTNLVGINALSDVQAQTLRTSMLSNSSDDPMGVAFGLVFVRSPNLEASDISIIAQMMGTAILGNDGMEAFLLVNGVSAGTLATFKKNLVSNAAAGSKDMSDYIEFFKNAVDNSDDDEMSKAGGIMGDIFIDAGAAAGIDPTLILASFSAAGSAPGLDALMGSLSAGFGTSIQQAVSSFFTRIASVKLKREYTDALTTLSASGSEVTRFNAAVASFVSAQQAIDVQYGDFFVDPDGYAIQVGKNIATIRSELDTAYTGAWSTFQAALQSIAGEISDMKTAVAAGLTVSTGSSVTVGDLPGTLGTDRDFNGNTVNWPIPQTVSVSWVASILSANGSFSFTRDALPVPSPGMDWLNGTGARTTFGAGGLNLPVNFADLMGLMEDVLIVEHTRFAIYSGGPPTADQEEAARLAYKTNADNLIALISGTTNGTTPISTAQKEALIKLMQEPSLF